MSTVESTACTEELQQLGRTNTEEVAMITIDPRIQGEQGRYERGKGHHYEGSDRTLRSGLLAVLLATNVTKSY